MIDVTGPKHLLDVDGMLRGKSRLRIPMNVLIFSINSRIVSTIANMRVIVSTNLCFVARFGKIVLQARSAVGLPRALPRVLGSLVAW